MAASTTTSNDSTRYTGQWRCARDDSVLRTGHIKYEDEQVCRAQAEKYKPVTCKAELGYKTFEPILHILTDDAEADPETEEHQKAKRVRRDSKNSELWNVYTSVYSSEKFAPWHLTNAADRRKDLDEIREYIDREWANTPRMSELMRKYGMLDTDRWADMPKNITPENVQEMEQGDLAEHHYNNKTLITPRINALQQKYELDTQFIELGRNMRAESTEFQNELRVDIRQWNGHHRTKKGLSLKLQRWSRLLANTELITEMIRCVRQGENPKEERIHIGGMLHVSAALPFHCLHLREWFRPKDLPKNSELLRPGSKGITLTFTQWEKLIVEAKNFDITIPNPCIMDDDHQNQLGALQCKECNPYDYSDY